MAKKQNLESIKAASGGLVGPIPEELANGDAYFSEAAKQLLKFHGMYQQHDREVKRGHEDEAERYHQFMIRTKVPGGQLTAAQYLVHDDIASQYGTGTLRITTRECFQIHGVLKGELRDTLRDFNAALVTTFGACGDIARNVMACPAPTSDPARLAAQEYAFILTRALFPRTSAYHQIWLDGEALIEDRVVDEPLYGPSYLPRKFKVGIAYEDDNCVDVFTHDVGLVALFGDDGSLAGFNLLVGGGMGMTHQNAETFPRLADPLGFLPPDEATIVETVKAILTIHRDYGDRENRKHARLKYIISDWGVERFREVLQDRLSFTLEAPRPLPQLKIEDHLGWHEQGDGKLYLGLPIPSGRIADNGDTRLRSGLRAIVERFGTPVRLTPQQNILLTAISRDDRQLIERLLSDYNMRQVEQLTSVRRYALACPALPTCGLAITEAERVIPQLLDEFETTLADLGIPNEAIVVRMTGCPNGCARPYVAEIGLVGRALNKYTLYLGGSAAGTRLAQPFLDLVAVDDLVPTLRPILARWRDDAPEGESFGDYCARVGFDALHQFAAALVAGTGD